MSSDSSTTTFKKRSEVDLRDLELQKDDKQNETPGIELIQIRQESVEQGNGDAERKKAADQKAERLLQITLVVSFYFFVSIALVFLNKILMKDYEFDFPLFVTWYQCLVTIIMVWIMNKLNDFGFTIFSLVPPIEFDLNIARGILPLNAIFIGMVATNNLCLQHSEVTFYQVARSLTICFTILFTWFLLNTKTSLNAVFCSLIVMLGFLLGSIGEVHYDHLAVIFGILASVFVSLNGIFVKKVSPLVENNNWRLLIYNNILSIIFILPIVWLSGEGHIVLETPQFYDVESWVMLTISGVFGFMINIATYMQITYTSPLTHNISGTLKACVQTLLAIVIFQNPVSFLNGVGIILVIAGSTGYSFVRYHEMERQSAKSNKT